MTLADASSDDVLGDWEEIDENCLKDIDNADSVKPDLKVYDLVLSHIY